VVVTRTGEEQPVTLPGKAWVRYSGEGPNRTTRSGKKLVDYAQSAVKWRICALLPKLTLDPPGEGESVLDRARQSPPVRTRG